MKKLFLTIVVASCLILGMAQTSFAQEGFAENTGSDIKELKSDKDGFIDDSTVDVLNKFQQKSGFKSFAGQSNKNSINAAGLDSLSGLIYRGIDIIKYVVGMLAFIVIAVSLFQLITASAEKSEEEYTKVKNHLLYATLSVIAIIVIEYFFKNVFVVDKGNFLGSINDAKTYALAGGREIRGLYNFIQAIIGSIAVFMLVYAGFRLVTNAGNEEVVDKLKKQVIYSAMGLILVAISEFVVQDILFIDGGQGFNPQAAKTLIVHLTNFIAGFISLVAFLGFIYAGYLYVVSGSGVTEDNSEKVKKIIINGIIGILIAGGAFAVVNTVIQLDSTEAPQIIQNQLDNISK